MFNMLICQVHPCLVWHVVHCFSRCSCFHHLSFQTLRPQVTFLRSLPTERQQISYSPSLHYQCKFSGSVRCIFRCDCSYLVFEMHPAFIYTCSHLLGNFIKVCLTYLVSLGFQDDLAFAKGNRGKHGSLVTKFCCYECWHYGRWVVFATAHVQCAFCLRNPTFTCFPCRLKCFVSCYFDILI